MVLVLAKLNKSEFLMPFYVNTRSGQDFYYGIILRTNINERWTQMERDILIFWRNILLFPDFFLFLSVTGWIAKLSQTATPHKCFRCGGLFAIDTRDRKILIYFFPWRAPASWHCGREKVSFVFIVGCATNPFAHSALPRTHTYSHSHFRPRSPNLHTLRYVLAVSWILPF